MQDIGKHLSIHENLDLRGAAGNLLETFAADVDTVPDLLILLNDSAGFLNKESRQRLEHRISKLIEEDLAAKEYDSNEAQVYRRLLYTSALRSSEDTYAPSIEQRYSFLAPHCRAHPIL
ncbi:unnamed protein product [Strongylus vulgaris]|uniref:Uncharacterized protein n=1 Tax=Strongylus vulgaris TaxID=40348 RepID=A0A3P7I4Z2_STRVU|nr:unnamed protein product [Strongylus vulgaris]